MRRTSLASIVAIGITCLTAPACVQSTCSDWGSGCGGLADGSICTLVDGGGWSCYVPDGSSDGEAGDATLTGDASPDASRGDAGYDGSVHDGSASGDASPDAAQDAGGDGGCGSLTTTANCGSCGVSCVAPTSGTTSCELGDAGSYVCVPSCTGGLTDCSGACVSLTTVAHCGACGTSCTSAPNGGAPTCNDDGGTYACGFTCQAGEHACNGACYSNSDPPSTSGDTCIVSPLYGVFVSPSGLNTNTGTMVAPYQTIAHALQNLNGTSRIYACGNAGTYNENVSITSGVSLYGGLDCVTTPTQWTYNGADIATVSVSAASGPALKISGTTADVEDVAFVSGDAATTGGSSIAVFVTSASTATFERCTMTAGNGMSAVPGVTASNYTGVSPSGSVPDGGIGGAGGSNTCVLFGSSIGGVGGSGATGGDGGNGSSTPATTPDVSGGYDGTGGAGGTPHCGGVADPGANGAPATTAASGATRWGMLAASGWTPQGGDNGGTGNPGQGGGGGGGVKNSSTGGAGGGAGGCGGAGGAGGAGGGSSFALLVYQSTVTLDGCTLSAGFGGSGAAGALGQLGQSGGVNGLSTGCNGGYGGNGAGGGSGGGGAGGLSAAIGYVGTAVPTVGPSNNVTVKAGGLGGAGVATGAGGGSGNGNPADGGLPSTGGIDGGALTAPVNLQ